MRKEQIIQDLETYFSIFRIEEHSATDNWQQPSCSESRPVYRFLTMNVSENMDSEEMLKSVLDHCDEETLDELIQTYGEESPIAQMIRRKNAAEYNRIACDVRLVEGEIKKAVEKSRYEGNPFYESVCRYMDKKGFKNDADFYNSISMPRQQFARLRNAANTLSKKTVLWIIVGLRLDYKEAGDLLQKAGYHFRKNDMRDVILMYIFRNTTYDLDMVNQVLEHFQLPPLC